MKKYISIDNGLLTLCISLFLFMMFMCSQLLFSGYKENEYPKQYYIINEEKINAGQIDQVSEILREKKINAYIGGIHVSDEKLFDRNEVRLWLYSQEQTVSQGKTMIEDSVQDLEWKALSEDDRLRIAEEGNKRETEFEKLYLVFLGEQEPDEASIRSITSYMDISRSDEQSPERGNYLQSFQDKMMLYSVVVLLIFGIVCMFSFAELWIYSRQREWMICRIYGFGQGDIAKGILRELLAVYAGAVGCGIILALVYHLGYHYIYMMTGKWMLLMAAEITIAYLLFSGYIIAREYKMMNKDTRRLIL